MPIRLIVIALWAFLLRGTFDDPYRPARPFRLVLEAAMLAASVLWALSGHRSEVEASRREFPWVGGHR